MFSKPLDDNENGSALNITAKARRRLTAHTRRHNSSLTVLNPTSLEVRLKMNFSGFTV